MKSQGNLKFQQNKCHPRDVRDTRRQFAKATDHKFESVWIETSSTCVYTREGKGLSGALLVGQAQKICQNPSVSDGISRL
jgi:hypothetical protein